MYTIGIDLGGTNIVAGVVDENYKIIATGEIKTNCPRPAEEIIDDMAAAARTAIEKAGLKIEDIDFSGFTMYYTLVNGEYVYIDNIEAFLEKKPIRYYRKEYFEELGYL